jgi:hypothetical protein
VRHESGGARDSQRIRPYPSVAVRQGAVPAGRALDNSPRRQPWGSGFGSLEPRNGAKELASKILRLVPGLGALRSSFPRLTPCAIGFRSCGSGLSPIARAWSTFMSRAPYGGHGDAIDKTVALVIALLVQTQARKKRRTRLRTDRHPPVAQYCTDRPSGPPRRCRPRSAKPSRSSVNTSSVVTGRISPSAFRTRITCARYCSSGCRSRPSRACPRRPASLLFRRAVEVVVEVGEVVDGDFCPLCRRHGLPNGRQLSLQRSGGELHRIAGVRAVRASRHRSRTPSLFGNGIHLDLPHSVYAGVAFNSAARGPGKRRSPGLIRFSRG